MREASERTFPSVRPFGSRRCVREAVPPIDDRSTAGEQIMRMLLLGRSVRHAGGAGAILGITLAVGAVASTASAGTVFTWDPSAVSPALGGAAAFTADTIDATHYLYDIGPIANPSPVLHTVNFIEQITGFTLNNGTLVGTPGLNGPPGAAGSYGLYLTMQTQTQGIGPPNTYQYLSGHVALMLDPGNNDGAASSTPSGLTFANPAATADDITLATGSLVSGHYTLNPAPGIRSIGDFVQTFQPAAGEGAFFVTPVSPHDLIDVVPTTPPSAIQFFPDPGGDPPFRPVC